MVLYKNYNRHKRKLFMQDWIFSKTESIFVLRDKLLPGTKPDFLKSEKMLRFIHFKFFV